MQLLVDQLNSIFVSTNSTLNMQKQEMNMIACLHPKHNLYGYDATIEDVYYGLMRAMEYDIKKIISLFQQMPGIGSIIDKQNLNSVSHTGCIIYTIVYF